MREDTIAAISTAYGEGGIGIIRISGEDAADITARIFTGKLIPGGFSYGHIRDNSTGKTVDEVIVLYYKAPRSYTAEDVTEIQCHGSFVSLKRILALVIENGARLAEPGEFTKRAFLNGRLDLSQAEAVMDLIKAKTDSTFDVALDQLEGGFSESIREIRGELTDVLVDLTVNIDYPDEDIEEITYGKLISTLCGIREEIRRFTDTLETGKIMREGLRISIIGKPNVGKSSLMNALLRESRAIVTAIPGTTRDTIEEAASIRGIPVIITDTAGIRETEDEIERIGIEKSKEAFNRADLIIFVGDLSREPDRDDEEIIKTIGDRKVICLLNKSDLERSAGIGRLKEALPGAIFVEASMKDGSGTEELEEAILSLVYNGRLRQREGTVITNVRHGTLLKAAQKSLDDAISMARRGEALELLEIDIKSAYESLGLIIGEEVEDDIIDEVFRRFCLGK